MALVPTLIVLGVLVMIVLGVYVILTLIQLRQTLRRIDSLVVNTDRELTPLLINLRETSEHLKTSVIQLQNGMQRAEGLLEALGAVGDSISAVNEAMRGGVSRYLGQIMAIWSGIKIASQFFRRPQPEEETVEGE